MLMADTMAIFFVILGLLLAFPSLWLLCLGLWPKTATAAADYCSRGLIKPFFAGVPITLAMIFMAGFLNNIPGAFGNVSAIGTVCLYILFSSTGVSGFATSIGRRLASPVDTEKSWMATLRGGIVLELSYLLPVLGWFVILPASITIGCGAAALARFKREPKTSLVSVPPHTASLGTTPPVSAIHSEAAIER